MGLFGGSSKQTVGYQYFMGLHFMLCYGPVDRILRMRVGEREMWVSSNIGGGDADITASGQWIVDGKLELFGGKKSEGGVGATGKAVSSGGGGGGFWDAILGLITPPATSSGTGGDFSVAMGEATQATNNYINTQISGAVPAYRGMLGLVFQDFYIGNNAYIKDFDFQVERFPNVIPAAGNSRIGDDANPAHMIWETFTNADWGMGYTAGDMDLASFQSASSTLSSEGFGMSLVWGDTQQIEDFLKTVLDHINGSVFMDLVTGLFVLKLIRDDYVIGTLPVFNESNIVDMKSFGRKTWGETVNEITVVYKDNDTNIDIPVTVQDLANVQLQGAVINSTRQYPGISYEDLALRTAARDLQTVANPLAKVIFRVNREAWDIAPAEPFVLEWPKYGIVQVAFRVGEIDYGSMKDQHITITAIEDIFALPASTYSKPQPSGWVEPRSAPQVPANRFIREMTFYERIEIVGLPAAEVADPLLNYYLVTAAKPESSHLNMSVRDRDTGTNQLFETEGAGEFAPSGTITAELPTAIESTFVYDNDIDAGSIVLASILEMNGELMQIFSLDLATKTIMVYRGMFDTVPLTHGLGSRFYANDDNNIGSLEAFGIGAQVDIKILTTSGLGELSESLAPVDVYTFTGRQGKPYPPGNLKVEGLAAFVPQGMTAGDFNITWSPRDRTQQSTTTFIYQDGGDVGPEAGVTYNLRLYNELGALVKTETGIVTNFYDWITEAADSGFGGLNSLITIQLESERAGLVSHTAHQYAFRRADYGYSYGMFYGGYV